MEPRAVRNVILRTGYVQGLKKLVKQHKYKEYEDVLSTVEKLRTFQITK